MCLLQHSRDTPFDGLRATCSWLPNVILRDKRDRLSFSASPDRMGTMVEPEEIVEGEWAEWYRLTPLQRWHASGELWEHYLQIGGSLDPEADTESPFYDGQPPSACPADGRPGVRVLRRSGV